MQVDMDIERAFKTGDTIWFVTPDSPCFYKMDILCNIAQEVEGLDKELCKNSRFSNIIYNMGSLFLIPKKGNILVEYIIQEMRYKYFLLNIPHYNTEGGHSNFIISAIYNDYLYTFGRDYDGIVSLNLKTGDSEFLSVSNYLIAAGLHIDNTRGFFGRERIIGRQIYVTFCNTNALLKFDLVTKNIEIIEIGTPGDSFNAISRSGNNIYIYPLDTKNTKIVKFNIKTCREVWIDEYPLEIRDKEKAFYLAFDFNDKALVVSHKTNMNAVLDYKTNRIISYPGFQNNAKDSVHIYQQINNSIFFMNHILWGTLDFDTQKNVVNCFAYSSQIRAQSYMNRIKDNKENYVLVQEDGDDLLDDFINMLSYDNLNSRSNNIQE